MADAKLRGEDPVSVASLGKVIAGLEQVLTAKGVGYPEFLIICMCPILCIITLSNSAAPSGNSVGFVVMLFGLCASSTAIILGQFFCELRGDDHVKCWLVSRFVRSLALTTVVCTGLWLWKLSEASGYWVSVSVLALLVSFFDILFITMRMPEYFSSAGFEQNDGHPWVQSVKLLS